MSESDYFGLGQSSTCTCCGAGIGNNYQHNPHCIINLPEHTPRMIFQWKQGKKEYESDDETFALPAFDTQDPLSVAYNMGRHFAKVKESAERTTESLEQAVEIVRKRIKPTAQIAR